MKVAIVGANGYGGGELIRLLKQHPEVSSMAISSRQYEGQPLQAAWPNFPWEGVFESVEAACTDAQVVFLASPNGVAMGLAENMLAAGQKVIDLSADYRLPHDVFETWYNIHHQSPQLIAQAVYGLCELRRAEIQTAQLIANPGCYVTSVALALHPLAQAGLISGDVIVDAVSGVSGAGRGKAETAFSEVAESFKAYGVGGTHRHTPEMEQNLAYSGHDGKILFTPHLVPMNRGILATIYVTPSRPTQLAEIEQLYRDAYANEPFVRFQQDLPQTKAVAGSNRTDIAVRYDARTKRILVFSALDNLVKGAAGQAVQNFNIMHGFAETTALPAYGIWP